MLYETTKKLAKAALGRAPFVAEEEQAYRRLAAAGFTPSGIVDVGAYEGNWARLARRVFPDAPIIMVEPQKEKQTLLEATCAELGNVSYVPAVLGAKTDTPVTFYEMETGSSMLPENSNVPRKKRNLITRTLDDVAVDLSGPLLIKLDVQGAELQVLEGAQKTLQHCEVVQLEVAVLPYNDGAPTFLEAIS